MAEDFDTAGKHLFDRHPLALLGWPVPPADGGVTVVEGDVSTVSRAADKVVRVDGVAVPYVAHVEFQSGGPCGAWRSCSARRPPPGRPGGWTSRRTRTTGCYLPTSWSACVIDLGTDKFGPPDEAAVARLTAVIDPDPLRQLGRRLLTARTWAELFADE